jgi:2-haloacid dehalogenase
MTPALCAFDAYGTLFDVAAAARRAASEPGFERIAEHPGLAETWRAKQLSYTWLRAAYGCHTDFWTVTTQALDYALEAHGLDGDDALRGRLLSLYWELEAFAEVRGALSALREGGRRLAILSNGEPEMLEAAVASAGLADLLDAVLSAEQAGVFKPHRAVYDLVGQQFGLARREVLFVSSNGWDAAFATGYGFRTLWVNRKDEPLERLPFRPDYVAATLEDLPEMVSEL